MTLKNKKHTPFVFFRAAYTITHLEMYQLYGVEPYDLTFCNIHVFDWMMEERKIRKYLVFGKTGLQKFT